MPLAFRQLTVSTPAPSPSVSALVSAWSPSFKQKNPRPFYVLDGRVLVAVATSDSAGPQLFRLNNFPR